MRPSLLVVVLLAAEIAYARDARAANELCGQTITSNITFTADQTCAGDGLIVGADGIPIDLGGFTLRGDRDSGDVGIEVNHHSKITIRNGTVRSFDVGLRSEGFDSTAVKV